MARMNHGKRFANGSLAHLPSGRGYLAGTAGRPPWAHRARRVTIANRQATSLSAVKRRGSRQQPSLPVLEFMTKGDNP